MQRGMVQAADIADKGGAQSPEVRGQAVTHEELEEILGCPSLPSLPAVALRVIELTKDDSVEMKELAATIENDQALAAKILRTVNSSFYAVRTRCATISKALVLLGLAPVKTLALGFSLVSAVSSENDRNFDFVAYWRRGLYTGVAAKRFAEAAGVSGNEEAFLAGLLQDVGMVAMHRALGERYLAVLAQAGGDHRKLSRLELAAIDLQHAEIGAMLAQRWKLPEELVIPVRYHERPSAAPREHAALTRCVGLGNLAHDALTDADPVPATRRLYVQAGHWFGLPQTRVDEVMRQIAAQVKEMSALFRLETGSPADVEAVLAKAGARMLELSKPAPGSAAPGSGIESLIKNGAEHDALTGTLARSAFDRVLREQFTRCTGEKQPLALAVAAIDGYKAAQAAGHGVVDDVVVGVATLLRKHTEPMGGVVCRIGPDLFAAVIPGATRAAAHAAASEFVADVLRSRGSWRGPSPSDATCAPAVASSVGVAVHDTGESGHTTPEALVKGATRAVQTARTTGGARVEAAGERRCAA